MNTHKCKCKCCSHTTKVLPAAHNKRGGCLAGAGEVGDAAAAAVNAHVFKAKKKKKRETSGQPPVAAGSVSVRWLVGWNKRAAKGARQSSSSFFCVLCALHSSARLPPLLAQTQQFC